MRDDIASVFLQQSAACERLGSPFSALLCAELPTLLDTRSELGRRVEAWSPARALADALPLRVTGGLHALARSGRAAYLTEAYPPAPLVQATLRAAVERAVREHDAFLTAYLESPPQTNEVARSAALLGGALKIAAHARLPLAWYEIGASAGLNLAFEQYRYELGLGSYGDAHAPVHVRSRWELAEGASPDALPPLDAPLSVCERAGCDVSPLDPHTDEACERLLSYVWPDQRERLERTEAALAYARRAGFSVAREPASTWLPRQMLTPRAGVVRTLVHTIMWQYLPEAERAAVAETMRRAAESATEQAPVAWLSMEAQPGLEEGAALRLAVWPGYSRRLIGLADFHGRWVRFER